MPTSQQDKIKHRFENDEEYIESGYIINVRKGKESEVAQSCPTLCDPRDCGLSGSSVHGIFQARVLERGAMFTEAGINEETSQLTSQFSSVAQLCLTLCNPMDCSMPGSPIS